MHNVLNKSAVTLNTMGGLVTYAGPDSIPGGASPRCHDVDFTVGGVQSRLGTSGVYSFAGSGRIQPGNSAVGSTWLNPINAFSTTAFARSTGDPSGPLVLTEFAFSVTEPVTGIEVSLNCVALDGVTTTAQLTQDGKLIGAAKVISETGAVTFGTPTDLWGASPNVNDVTFGVQISTQTVLFLSGVQVNSVAITVYSASVASNFNYVKSFVASNGTIMTLALDASGNLWVEDVTNNPGVLSLLLGALPVGSYAKSVTADDREYIALNNLRTGTDIGRQYTGQWVDKITQVAPGAPPQFTPQAYSGNDYAITSITQPAAAHWSFAYFLQSSGPGVTSSGNTVTVYYADQTAGSAGDTDLINTFNSGNPVYLYFSFTGGPSTQGPIVIQVTSVGLASPPGQPHKFYYFTYNVITVAAVYYQGSGHSGYTANYQRTLATLTASEPVPGLLPGNQITVSGTSVAGYNSVWSISQDVNSGSVVITQTAVSSGVATFSYSLSAGVAPMAGQQITITGTTNADGALNGANLTIATASGGSSGTFTIAVSVPDAAASPEEGLGVTAGSIFDFDPGQLVLNTSTNPIYGNATGGQLVFAGTTQLISSGTYQGVVFFGTRNSAETPASIPIQFTVPANTSALVVSQIPIGPPNTAYRQVSLTEAGQLGQPGGNFFTIDNPVKYTVNGLPYISNSFRINDNSTTSLVIEFRNSDLLAGRPIDQQGEDLFNQIEIGSPGWIVQYADRLVYGLTQQVISNFVNLSFDGGFLPNATPQPLGWTILGTNGSLLVSPSFGNSYYIQNSTGTAQSTLGLISQSAYLDYYGVQILRPTIQYSVRVTARIPSGLTVGNLLISLNSAGAAVASYSIPFASMTTTMRTYSGVLFTVPNPVPADLTINVQATGIAAGADVEIDRIEVFTTRQPVNETTLLVSYEDDPEGVDQTTGQIGTASENPQPCYGAVVMYDLLYLLKDRSMYYTQDSSGNEPDQWQVHEVSNKAGACGVNAYDSGEEWIEMANRNGAYVFEGGTPRKFSQEIQDVWEAINWGAAQSIWLRKDVAERKTYIGVPLPTPNFWLPDAPVNAAPQFPNVILMCSTEGQGTGSEVADANPISDTFYGDLIAEDLHRKWTIWQIPCPYADFITQANGEDQPLLFGNGLGNSKIYELSATNDDGALIPWRYCTYGFGNDKDLSKFPALGPGRKRWNYLKATISGSGSPSCTLYSNKIDGATQYTIPNGILLDSGDEDRERPLNVPGQRVFVEFAAAQINDQMDLSQMTMFGAKDTFNAIRGTE